MIEFFRFSLSVPYDLYASNQGILKSIIVPLTSCLTGLDFKLVKQEDNSTVILSPLAYPASNNLLCVQNCII